MKNVINEGSSRVVYLTKSFAIKVPRVYAKPRNEFYGKFLGLLNGWRANRYEYIWSKSNTFDFLCRVRCSFFFSLVIVMDRAEPLSAEEFRNLTVFDFGYEHKLDSYGKIIDKIVIVDYGN